MPLLNDKIFSLKPFPCNQFRDIQTKSSMIYSENIEGRYSISWSLSHSWRSKAVIPLGCLETSATLEKRGEESFFSAWDRFVDTWNGHGSIIDRGREMNRRGTDFRINRVSCCEFTRSRGDPSIRVVPSIA